MCLSPERVAPKRAKLGSAFKGNTPDSPSTSTALKENCSSLSEVNHDENGVHALKDTKALLRDENNDDINIKSESSPRPEPCIFDMSNEKIERQESEDNASTETSMVTETSSDAYCVSLSPPTGQVSFTTETKPIPTVAQKKDIQGNEEDTMVQLGARGNSQPERDQCLPLVEIRQTQELQTKASIQEFSRTQTKDLISLKEENKDQKETENNCTAAKLTLDKKSELWRGKTNGGFSVKTEKEIEDSSEKLTNTALNHLDREKLNLLVVQQERDKLRELLKISIQVRQRSQAKVQQLTSQVKELQNKLTKERCEQSTQTSTTEELDYKELYLQSSEEVERLRCELEKEKVKNFLHLQRKAHLKTEDKGTQTVVADLGESMDELSHDLDYFIRELEMATQEQDKEQS